ncbi:hypothetical protein EON65_19280 [archaeon]|nr:MAG: hypothetical protein EON65_19280 [archaeon]
MQRVCPRWRPPARRRSAAELPAAGPAPTAARSGPADPAAHLPALLLADLVWEYEYDFGYGLGIGLGYGYGYGYARQSLWYAMLWHAMSTGRGVGISKGMSMNTCICM